MATVTTIDAERLESFSAVFSGSLLESADDGYEHARQIHNGLIDRRPALIARCRGTADVVDAIALAVESELEISVRGGGHNVGGRSVTDGGLMIDLAEMKGIHVDPGARTVRAQGGVNWAELNRETALHGLAVTGGQISTTGVAGFTLGGGLGWLMALYGLAADNLLSVELVTAGGDVLNVTADSNPDLFLALRGGGGNFGIATSFEFRLHPVTQIIGGLIAFPIDTAGDFMRFYRELTQSASDELTVHCVLAHAPDGSGMKLAALAVCHTGSADQADAELARIRAFGSPVIDHLGPMPYPAINAMLDAAYPKGALNYWKSSFISELSDSLIDEAVARFAVTPSPMNAILFEHYHGAVTRIRPTDTAVPHRQTGYNMLLPSIWLDPADTEANIAWTRETYDAFRPWFADGRWLNYLDDDDREDATRAAYGPNYERLARIKGEYDPDNVFHLNQNILPA
jgi:FAD/FMN-containing dehydrogenase